MVKSERLRFALLLVCFFLSGFAALLYETAWTRQFSFVFGTSELAVSAVLAAYMAGLALGAALAARFAGRLRRPVLAYGVLELLIAVGALAVPLGIRIVTGLYLSWLGGQGAPPDEMGLTTALFHLAGAFLVLVPCTALMGATLPLLARHAVQRDDQIGPRVGILYAVNTVGAIGGTLCAAFVLLPEFGLRSTTYVGAAVNAAVFVAAALLAPGDEGRTAYEAQRRRGLHWILPLMALSGAASFVYEVLWMRMLGHVLGGSTYAFSTMLASFLLGIALGSALASRLARSPAAASFGFALAQIATAAFAWIAFQAADQLPALAASIGVSARNPGPGILLAGGILLPFTLCIGATFPFAVRMLAAGADEAAASSARVYAWNTVGSIVGSIAAGFALLPLLGLEGTLALGVATNFGLAALAGLLVAPRRVTLAGLAAAGAVTAISVPLEPPWQLLRNAVMSASEFQGELAYLGVGRSATVTMFRQGSKYRIATNGLPESAIERPEVPPTRISEVHWLSLLPVLARPETEKMLIVGLGGGNTLAAVPSSVRSIDIIELEPEVVTANRLIPARRGGDPLADPRVTLRLGDARGALTLADTRYDAIVSQPSHPWTSGASHLYTREFFELAHAHLTPGGVFTQWIGLSFVNEELLRTLIATLLSVFPHLEVYRPLPAALIFVGSDAPLETVTASEVAIAAAPASFALEGIHRSEDVMAALALDTPGSRAVADAAPINTDDHNRLASGAHIAGGRFSWATRLLAPHDPLPNLLDHIDVAPMARRLASTNQHARLRTLAAALAPAMRANALGWGSHAAGRAAAAQAHFERALRLDPGAASARMGLIASRRSAEGLDPTPREAALVEGWRRRKLDVAAIAELEDALATWQPRDLLYPEAAGLRVRWRIASGDPALAAEALAMVDALLARSQRRVDYLLRAMAAEVAGRPAEAWAGLDVLVRRLIGSANERPLARAALEVAERLPADSQPDGVLKALRRKGS